MCLKPIALCAAGFDSTVTTRHRQLDQRNIERSRAPPRQQCAHFEWNGDFGAPRGTATRRTGLARRDFDAQQRARQPGRAPPQLLTPKPSSRCQTAPNTYKGGRHFFDASRRPRIHFWQFLTCETFRNVRISFVGQSTPCLGRGLARVPRNFSSPD